MDTTDGGPAFPVQGWDVERNCVVDASTTGMSLRDYFAGQALAGWLQNGAIARIVIERETSVSGALIVLSASCYQLADAMLAARKR